MIFIYYTKKLTKKKGKKKKHNNILASNRFVKRNRKVKKMKMKTTGSQNFLKSNEN